jgi:response regulator RpfG family c-di-GMP phosphodiesterase
METVRILIAEEDPMMPLVVAALQGYELIEAYTFEQAVRMILEDGIDVVVIGIHFDDSRAMELITYIRTNKEHHKIPIVVHRLCHSEYAGLLRTSLLAMKSLRFVNEYLELENDPHAKSRIREVVEAQLIRH